MSYCGTCKSDPCRVDDGQMCCHDLVRWGQCSGHAPVRKEQFDAFNAMMEAERYKRDEPSRKAIEQLEKALGKVVPHPSPRWRGHTKGKERS